MSLPSIPEITIDEALARYDVLLFDAFGVLVRTDGPLPGAAALIARLHEIDKPYTIVTNDASRSIATTAARFASFGMPIPASRIITSGSLIGDYIQAHGLAGARCLTLGSPDALASVADAGGVLVEPGDTDAPIAALCLADIPRRGLIEALEGTVTTLLATIDAGHAPHLVLPNPDLIYPRSADRYGLTAGAFAHMILGILEDRYPGRTFRFERLGKPHPFIFERAMAQHPGTPLDRVLMIGDQLPTDILGARRFGIDAALVRTGLARDENISASDVLPTAWLGGLG